MSYGHYIGFAKNYKTGEWLKYDDSKCSHINEDEVQTKAAYILFYKRKDIAGKSLSDVVPTLNLTKFPGMPVRLKSGKVGYLIEYREGNPCPYKVSLGTNTTLYLSSNSVEDDPDRWPGPKEGEVKDGDKKTQMSGSIGARKIPSVHQ